MNDLDVLARTLYGEAESGNVDDAVAIAWVVMNRVHYAKWPDTVAGVCLQPWQFSCWNQNDPNRQRILNASGEWYEKCKEIAAAVIKTEGDDPTDSATHYYATYVKKPKWAEGRTPCYSVPHKNGHAHVFFNDIDTPPPSSAREALEQVRPLHKTRTIKAAQTGVATAGVLSVAAEAVNQLQPAIPLLQTLAQYAPWAIAVLLVSVIGYMAWQRIEARVAGDR